MLRSGRPLANLALVLAAALAALAALAPRASRVAADPPPPDPDLSPYLAQISESTYVADILRLQAFVSRHTFSDSLYAVSNWLGSRFASYGYTDVRYDSLTAVASWGEKRVANVIAVKPGHLHPDREVIVCAHYDDFGVGSPTTYAPGADDNASGIAAVLEMARILAHVPMENTLLFITFAAEEQGLQGSYHFADSVAARGDSIIAVLNMDMIANYVTGDWHVLIHKDARSAALAGTMAALASQYTTLVPVVDDAAYPNGDYWPFMADSIAAVEEEEHVRSSCWHLVCDLWGPPYSSAYAKQIVRMVMAQLITSATLYTGTAVAEAGGGTAEAGSAAAGAGGDDGAELAVRPLPGAGPFTIRYRGAPAPPVAAHILDIHGRAIREIGTRAADAPDGQFHWDARDASGREAPPGVYFIRVSGDGWSRTTRIIVVR